MKNILSKKNIHKLKELSLVKDLVLAFDFDGTLSKIVNNPKKARIRKSTLSLIKKLHNKYIIAIVSGRKLKDIKKLIKFKPDYILGNHGFEERGIKKKGHIKKIGRAHV